MTQVTAVSAQHRSGLARGVLLATVLSLAHVASGGKPGNPDDAAWAEYGDRNASSAAFESRRRALPGFVDADEVGAASSTVAALLADPTMPKIYRYLRHSYVSDARIRPLVVALRAVPYPAPHFS